jgi:hypothetical protein
MLVDYGHKMARFLGVPPRSSLSWVVHVWTAFLLSGVMHALPAWSMHPAPPFIGIYERFTSPLMFFILQAVGLTVEAVFEVSPAEDILLHEFGAEDVWFLGRLWTFGWLLYSGHFALESWLKTELGMLAVPYSLCSIALKQLGI